MFLKKGCFFLIVLILSITGFAQTNLADSGQYVTVTAGAEYDRSRLHEWLLGKNRRDEWSTPVQVPVVLLDTLYGGIVPYETGGGGESKSLRLKSAAGKEYALRSINKSRIATMPLLLKNTFVGTIAQDAVSMSHPYAAFAITLLLREAGIHHTQPRLVYLPRHAALDTFNDAYANNLYLLEERPDGNWSSAPHLGRYKEYLDTEEVKEKLTTSNQYKPNQTAFIKARLIDLLISDVDRHAGNWKWGVADTGIVAFHPVPLDRDQAFFTHNGLLTSIAIAITRRRLLQTFGYTIKNVKTLTSHDGKLDRFFANEMSEADWVQAAALVQESLTDSVITAAVEQMPREIFSLSGNKIIEKLKYRRAKLDEYASRYYTTLAKKVAVNGSRQQEHFEIVSLSNKKVAVSVYRIDSVKGKEAQPYYQRTFSPEETKLITLFGFGGADVFDIDKAATAIKIKLFKGINKAQYPDRKE